MFSWISINFNFAHSESEKAIFEQNLEIFPHLQMPIYYNISMF